MYEKIVKELREEAEWAKANEWETPIMLSDHLTQAAETIEALEGKVKYLIDRSQRADKACEDALRVSVYWREQVVELAKYKDAEAEGRLVILPCKVGTPVWSSVMCRLDENGAKQPGQWPFMISMMDEWGTGFFLSYEEAKDALR